MQDPDRYLPWVLEASLFWRIMQTKPYPVLAHVWSRYPTDQPHGDIVDNDHNTRELSDRVILGPRVANSRT